MSFITIYTLLFLLSGISASSTQEKVPSQSQSQSYTASRQNEDVVLQQVRPVLRANGYAGFISYSGSCYTRRPDFVGFPAIDVSRPGGSTTLGAIRGIFANDAAVKVTERPGKVVAIRIGSPPDSILRTKVSRLRLSPLIQFNAPLAVFLVMGADEVQAELDRLNFYTPQVLNSGLLLAKPGPGLPHLPAVLRGVNLQQIFDLIAKTFDGIVVYGTCIQPNGRGFVNVNFVGLE